MIVDLHTHTRLGSIGRCVTIFQRQISNEQDLVDELKAAKFRAWNRTLNWTF